MKVIVKHRGNTMTIEADDKGDLIGSFDGKKFTGDMEHIKTQFHKHIKTKSINDAKKLNQTKGGLVNNGTIINK